ncbi:branched-chain amino acid ABC transporter permease [Halorarius litoreus]|uniref:branched-chain amino acid ABC transporter permease n=1 Tax=Halorarius litoreus TaxID=2962676 RepID=UPI0020CC842D|nr:branched-chain amino acid ABC transporter permease [Halorarius litoreus]
MSSALSVGRLKQVPIRYWLGLLAFVGLAVLPSQLSTLDILTMSAAFFFVCFVISWDFVSGYTGMVSFGHTLFFALGGYSTAILNLNYGIDPVFGIVVGIVVAGLAGLLIGLPALRIDGHYLALFTLLPPLILLRMFQLFREETGGSRGLPDPANLIEMDSFAATAEVNYYLAFGLFVFIFLLTFVITRSDTGKIFTAIKESEDAVSSAGINPDKFKIYAFTLSAALGGLAGAVFVHTPAGSPSPTQLLGLVVMIEVLIAAIFGGFGTITGATFGGFFFFWVTNWFEGLEYAVPVLDVPITRVDEVLFFLLMLALLMYLREGVLPWATRSGRRIVQYANGGDPQAVADGGRPPLDSVLENYRETYDDMIDRINGRDR